MYKFILGLISGITIMLGIDMVNKYSLNIYGYILSIISLFIFYGVLSFIGNAYAENEKKGALRAGIAFITLSIVFSLFSLLVLFNRI